jgi:hypothetical protein
MYAPHGELTLQNSADLRQITAYKIRLKNTANVTYETGLISTLFSSGPGGSWSIEDWQEVE